MGTIYKRSEDVPTAILAARLMGLASGEEIPARVPPEFDWSPDLVMSEAARRLTALEIDNERLRNSLRWLVELKAEQEENGESALYLEERDMAWEEARALVG